MRNLTRDFKAVKRHMASQVQMIGNGSERVGGKGREGGPISGHHGSKLVCKNGR